MQYWWIPLAVFAAAAVLVLGVTCICFFRIFYSFPRKSVKEEYPTPKGKAYDPHREQIIQWIKEIRGMEHADVSVTSFDGLRLCGKYYEYKKGAPTEILFHGYKGTAERDLCGVVPMLCPWAQCFDR